MWLETFIVCVTVYLLFSDYWQAKAAKVEMESELIAEQILKLSEGEK